jgi:ribulose-phosphate 3-epimerase
MTYAPIVPAIIPPSREELLRYAEALTFSPEIQLDLVDGEFVSTVCWPYEPAGDPMSIKSQLEIFTLEVDLMVADPIPAAEAWLKAGADMIIFHIETLDLETFKDFADSVNISIGASAHGDTTMDQLSEYIEYADYIQLMGIHEIGAQGLPFDEKVLDKIKELKRRFPEKSITIDGSVNADTIVRLREAGADRFIAGSAVTLQPNPKEAHDALSALING